MVPSNVKIKDTAVHIGWNKQIYIESFHFHSQGHKYGFREGFTLDESEFSQAVLELSQGVAIP